MSKRWLRILLWAAGFGCLWLNLLDDPPLRSGAYVQHVTADAATIAKITAHRTRAECVVRAEGGAPLRIVGEANRRRHVLRATGLQPATQYEFELTMADGSRESGRFRTAPVGDDAAVRFAFLGDSGDQPWWVWLQRTPILHFPARWDWFPTKNAVTQVGAAIAGYQPDFALHLGDVIYPRGLHAHYRAGFFRPFADLIRQAPVYAVPGNHDVMDSAGVQLLANFRSPRSQTTGDGRCFSFAFGSVRVIGLDCNTHLANDHYREGYPTYEFLAAELARVTEPWVIVASHFPILSASRQWDRGDLMKDLLPTLGEHQVSLYLSGHDHCYQRFRASATGTPLVVSGGGGKRLYDTRPHAKVEVRKSAFHWCSAEAQGSQLTVVAHALDRSELDRFDLGLPVGDALDRLRASNPARAERIQRLLQ